MGFGFLHAAAHAFWGWNDFTGKVGVAVDESGEDEMVGEVDEFDIVIIGLHIAGIGEAVGDGDDFVVDDEDGLVLLWGLSRDGDEGAAVDEGCFGECGCLGEEAEGEREGGEYCSVHDGFLGFD
mgnify:CR=1 FL=1